MGRWRLREADHQADAATRACPPPAPALTATHLPSPHLFSTMTLWTEHRQRDREDPGDSGARGVLGKGALDLAMVRRGVDSRLSGGELQDHRG